MAISTQDIYEAYRKLKTFVYYNGQPLSLRRKLAEFELEMLEEDSEDSKISEDTPLSNPSEDLGVDIGNNLRDIFKESFKEKFSKRIEPLERILNGPTTSEAKNKIDFDHWLDEIRYTIVPKELREASPIDEHFITNEIAVEDYVVEKCNFIIDAPIEIYLIATLWTIKLGRRLNRLISRDNYAYRLSIFDSDWYPEAENEEEVSSGQLLYDPYFIGYREWRDRALNKVSDTLDNGENAVILSLDIKRYFYNVRLNVYDIVKTYLVDQQNSKPVIPQGIDPDETRLCLLLQKVHEKYATLFPEEQKMDGGKVLLPIGLPSSGLLGNLALKPLDDYIRNYVTPAYYGRYVDDILLVFSGKGLKITRHPESESNIDGFITDHLVCEQPVNFPIGTSVSFSRQVGEDRKSEISYCVKTGSSELYVKLEKVIMEFFNCNESRAAINKFKKQLEKNRSEFRYLPWEEEINLEFDDEAFRLEISDSVNKIRNIEGISEDKYGASKYLAKKIFLSTLPFDSVSKEESEASAKQILTYFKGRTPILMNSLWEKVATYFVINGQSRNLDKFRRQVLIAIGKVKAPNEENQDPGLPKFKEQEVRAALAEHLNISIALAVAVHPSILDVNSIDNEIDSKINKMADGFRQTYLFRHQYQYLKGYCYTLQMKGEEPLVSKNLISSKVNEIQPSYAPYVTPVFLKPHEISLLHIYHKLSTSNNPRENPLQDIRVYS